MRNIKVPKSEVLPFKIILLKLKIKFGRQIYSICSIYRDYYSYKDKSLLKVFISVE